MSDDDRGERERVYARIAPLIMDFHTLFAGEMFHVEQYIRYSPTPLEAIDGFAVDYVFHSGQMETDAQNAAQGRFVMLQRAWAFR